MRRLFIIGILLALIFQAQAQDGLNLPTELYILLNEGSVQRYGLGTAGVRTVTDEAAFVLDFGVAPDGNWIAYRTPDGIYISDMFGDEVQEIEGATASVPNIRGQGSTLEWSPTSDALAYTTEVGGRVAFLETGAFADLPTAGLFNLKWSPMGQFLAAEAVEGVWWIFARQDQTMVLVAAIPGANGGDWLDETNFLYASIEGGITSIDLLNRNAPTIILDSTNQYYLPYIQRSGRLRVFEEAEEENLATLIEVESIGINNVVLEIGANPINITNVRWAPRGQLLVAFEGGVLALIEPLSGAGFTLPITGAAVYGWGPNYAPSSERVPISQNGYFRALDNSGVMQVWRLPADGSLPFTVTPSAFDISEFAVSSDGTRIAYISNGALWAFAFGTEADAIEIAELGISDNISPAWGPDNEMLYYRDEQEAGRGIWRVLVGEEPALFLADSADIIYANPRLANGVGAMLVDRNTQLVIVDTTSAEENPLDALGTGQWMAGTELLVNGNVTQGVLSGTGLFSFDVNDLSADPRLLVPVLGDLRLLDYQAQGNTVRVLLQRTTPGQVQILDVPRDGSLPAGVGTAGYIYDPSLSPDGNTVIGYTSPGGALTIFDIPSGQRTTIDTLPQVYDFVWE